MENLEIKISATLARKHWHQKWWGIILIILLILIVSLLFAFAFLVLALSKNIGDSTLVVNSAADQETKILIAGKGKNYWFGSAEPKITIIEFGDFACPMSKNSFSKIREISLKYKNDVKFIFRDYPTVADYSIDLALAARCAGDQGLFWLMHDRLFIDQGLSTNSEVVKLAGQIGADVKKFETCLSTKKYLSDILQDMDDAAKLKIAGTPTWFINGNEVAGDIPYSYFINTVETLIGKK